MKLITLGLGMQAISVGMIGGLPCLGFKQLRNAGIVGAMVGDSFEGDIQNPEDWDVIIEFTSPASSVGLIKSIVEAAEFYVSKMSEDEGTGT